MSRHDAESDLERQYRALLTDEQHEQRSVEREEPSLEQPHAGKIVPSFTTYSVDDDPTSF